MKGPSLPPVREVMLDRVALWHLLMTGTVRAVGDGAVAPPEKYVVLVSEYLIIYQAALRAGEPTQGCGRLHEVAVLGHHACECQDGWIPVLSPSFLSACVEPALEIRPLPADAIGMRLRLQRALPNLNSADLSLLVGLAWAPSPLIQCSAVRSESFSSFAREAGLVLLELDHRDCGACP
jgi:hypothetical protein